MSVMGRKRTCAAADSSCSALAPYGALNAGVKLLPHAPTKPS